MFCRSSQGNAPSSRCVLLLAALCLQLRDGAVPHITGLLESAFLSQRTAPSGMWFDAALLTRYDRWATPFDRLMLCHRVLVESWLRPRSGLAAACALEVLRLGLPASSFRLRMRSRMTVLTPC